MVREILDEALELHQTIDVWSVKKWLKDMQVRGVTRETA
jgi:hypothetical protein